MEQLLSPSSPPSSSFFIGGQEQPRASLDQPPPYSFTAGSRGSAIIASAPPTEENLFQIQELARPLAGSSSSQQQLICANPMHDQQYLLVGSGCALHSIDLTLPSDNQTIRTHIQGVAFREIHCLEDIGLVVVVAGRNSNVRCYDYDSIKRLVTYGHSKEGKGRVVEGGKLGPVKNMIQLRVETAALRDDTQSSELVTSPTGQSRVSRILKGASSSNPPPRHHHTTSIDRSLLSPPVQSESSPWNTDATDSDSSVKKHKQRPLSFGGLASMAQEHVSKNKQPPQQQSSSSTPVSPSTGSSTKNKRFSQMASYLSQAAVNSNVMAHMTNGDAPSEEAVAWAWDFTKLKQPKDVLGLDFHYTPSTVFMTVLSKTGIDIFSRPKSARGRKAALWSAVPSNPGSVPPSVPGGLQGTNGTHGEAPPRISINTGGTSSQHHHRDSNGGANPYEWKPYKQFYHPEAPGFMTVVKDSHEVTDIILGKGTRACVVSVDDMSVTDLHRQETSSVMHGISKKLGFRNNSLWHSFEKIPFDVPAQILYPAAAAAIYGQNDPPRDVKAGYHGHSRSSSDNEGRSRDNIMQRSSDQRSLHQQEQDELEEAEAQALAVKLRLQEQQYPPNNGSSSSSNAPYQAHPVSVPLVVNSTPSGSSPTPKKAKARMVTSDEVLNMAFSKQTTSQLFLATYGSQSRIVDIQGKPQSRVVLDWESFPPQKVEFLKTASDIYVVGFEKTSIVVFSLTRAKKVKEILKKDLLQATASASSSSSPSGHPSTEASSYAYTPSSSPNSSSSSSSNNTSINIKFLGRDNIAEDSIGIFFSYCHPKNGISICKLCILSLVHDDLELLGYYP